MRQWWMGLVVGAMIGGATGAGMTMLVQPRATVAASMAAPRAPEAAPSQVQDRRLRACADAGGAASTSAARTRERSASEAVKRLADARTAALSATCACCAARQAAQTAMC